MKYYAVTEDPRELYHYGVKGMKWGQHLFGDDLRPKSAAYKRAASKLRANLTNKVKTFKATAKASAEQRAIKRRANEQNNYMKAVQKTQNRMALLNNLSTLDNERKQYKQVVSADKHTNKADKYASKFARIEEKASDAKTRQDYKQAKKALKSEKHMNKLMQEAREGRLHYGRLSEEQISRVQNRLNMEEQARKLGGKEKPSWHQQKKEARRAGKLQGITRGTAAAMEETARAMANFGVNHALDRLAKRSLAKQEGKENKARSRAQNKKTHHEVKQDLKQELYEEQIRSGEGVLARTFTGKTAAQRANKLQELRDTKKLQEANTQARIDAQKDMDKEYYKLLSEGKIDDVQVTKGLGKLTDEGNREARINALNKVRFDENVATRTALENYEKEQHRLEENEAEQARYDQEKSRYDAKLEAHNRGKQHEKDMRKLMDAAEKELNEAESREKLYSGQAVPDVVKARTLNARQAYEDAKKKHEDALARIPEPPKKVPKKPKINDTPYFTMNLEDYQRLKNIGYLGSGNGGGKGKKPKNK